MNRDDMLAKIETLYKGRATGDFSQFPEVLAPHAEFRFVGDGSTTMTFPGGKTTNPEEAGKDLFAQLDLLDRRMESATVEENRAAVHWRVVLRFKGGDIFEMELFDLWEFGEDGRITKGSQWLDTATLMDQMDEADMARSASETRDAVETAKSDAARVDSMDFGIGSR
ncbi:nuclear transport factor 2 family protein [Erythrobacter sp. GH1-10]|uniref:nuclear transport factor 2 family protein n=1 Tax=Erythrobacter sp. GH1-10 TaxID=3349334 RepID=UPI0038781CA7